MGVTDHKPLLWLKNIPDPSPRLARWLFEIKMYEFDLEYREGNKNGNADALSRWLLKPSEEDGETFYNEEKVKDERLDPGIVINNFVLQELEFNEAQFEDPDIKILLEWVKQGERPEKCEKNSNEFHI